MSRRPGHVTTGPYAPPVPRTTLTVTSADGARLYAEVHGPEDAPAVVLAHGWTCSTAFWAPVVRELAAGHKVVVYDQRGHGRSPAAGPAGHSTHALADDLVAVLEATLRPGERAVVGGHSMGGMTIMAAAGRPQLRERAAAALLCSTGSAELPAESRVFPLRSPQGRRRAHRLMLHSRMPLGPVSPIARSALKYATMGPGATAEQIEACARIVHACPPGVRARWGKVLAGLELTGGVGRLELPTAVIAGTADRLTPLVHARRLASVLPDCRGLTELPGLGHMTPIEDAVSVAGRLRALVDGHLRTTGTRIEATAEAADATAEVPRTPRQKKEKTA
ncbi:alpha/beta fold hydrolase [Streptomyces decoyicus]|uniref:alpha/beta fold hydrolase n=1 Tax=Streptomyces decoyicus TaxID=249567 RepID=UPI00069FECAD|nr:alpha/beta fold hydrolase [Streptomyces decoyicus]KOG42699.1 alpha/beta hydrolase [Streptomyces decoyicus]QZY16483.1 alpha/beta hydrolase [Streptomyces decoyicus]